MYDYHITLGILAVLVGFIGEFLYIRDLYKKNIKPHPFSWLGWGLLDVVIFSAQVVKGAGAGSWVIGVAAVVNIAIALISFRQGERRIVWSDWICFLGTLAGIALWAATSEPFFAVLIASVVNYIAFIPTFRKAYLRPEEESLNIFVFDIVKFMLGILALQVLNPTTALFPAASALSNVLFVTMVLLRRKKLGRLSGIT